MSRAADRNAFVDCGIAVYDIPLSAADSKAALRGDSGIIRTGFYGIDYLLVRGVP